MKMNKIITLSVLTSSLICAGGYKIPEQSLNSMALGAAYVAHTFGADTAYFNPASMVFMENKQYMEASVTLAHLFSQEYALAGDLSGHSETENLPIATLHYVAQGSDDFRWGVSMTVPGGLTKRWNTPYQKLSAEEFTLKNIEINPVVAYKVSDEFSVGAGLRLVYSEGIVKSDGEGIFPIKREMEGNTIEFGYNLAAMYKPTSDINLALTYRSNIDLTEEGKANLYFGNIGKQYDAEVTVPLPAALNLAISKTWQDTYTLEFNYERTYWSTYENLDFDYKRTITNAVLAQAFDAPKARNWKDTDTFRIGATVKISDKLTTMLGFAIDETPVPVENIGFELPDSDAKIYSIGFRYQQTPSLSWGAAFLYDKKDELTLKPGEHEDKSSTNILNNGGKFSEGGAFLSTIGMVYEF
jgi:long-chain fatty acid transport protein